MKRFQITMASLLVTVLLSDCLLAENSKGEWRSLMDGKSLAGWHKVGDGQWTFENGAFVGRADNEKLYGLLVSDKTFKDFTIRFKYRFYSGDSGFYIRTTLKEPDE